MYLRFRLGNPAGMPQTCFALLIEFFAACLAKKKKRVQLDHKGLHPINAAEIQVGQSILFSTQQLPESPDDLLGLESLLKQKRLEA